MKALVVVMAAWRTRAQWSSYDTPRVVSLLRVTHVLFNRIGAWRRAVGSRLRFILRFAPPGSLLSAACKSAGAVRRLCKHRRRLRPRAFIVSRSRAVCIVAMGATALRALAFAILARAAVVSARVWFGAARR